MRSRAKAMVYETLARYMRTDAKRLSDAQQLEDDLRLDALDIALIAVRLEDAQPLEPAGVVQRASKEFPVDRLAGNATVGTLVSLFESWWYGAPISFGGENEEELPPTLRYA